VHARVADHPEMRMRDTHLTRILTNEVVALYLLLPPMLIGVTLE